MNRLTTHHDREDLTGEHRLGDAGQLIFFFLFLAVWATDSFIFQYSVFPNNYVPYQIRFSLGTILLIVSIYLAYAGIKIVFLEVRKTPGVIRDGIFQFLRHPVYFSEMLFYLGLLLFSISLAGLAVWILIVAFLHFISRYEEKLLLARFGDDYRRYMNEVPMYLPCILRRHLSQ